MLELRVKAGRRMVPIFDLPVALGRRGAAQEIGDTIDALISFMDDLGGDPDLEDGGDAEPDQETGDPSWPEWHTRGRHKLGEFASERRPNLPGRHYALEDDEDDDPAEANGDELDGSPAEDEFMHHPSSRLGEPGCPVSDPGGGDISDEPHDDDGDEQDGSFAEDEAGNGQAMLANWPEQGGGPGCPVSDPGEEAGDLELNGDEGDYSEGLPYWEN